jgi:hypothetical protein
MTDCGRCEKEWSLSPRTFGYALVLFALSVHTKVTKDRAKQAEGFRGPPSREKDGANEPT